MILDEPTAALDAETEHELFERYAEAAHSTTVGGITILVSHRFSTVRSADLIVVLDGSRLVEVGSHDDLLRRGRHLRRALPDPGGGIPALGLGALTLRQAQAKSLHPSGTTDYMRRLCLALLALGLVVLSVAIDPQRAAACDCTGISTRRAFAQSDAAFVGTVLRIDEVGSRDGRRADIRFSVERVFKGTVYAEQVVASAPDPAACGLTPRPGSNWVIFAVDAVEGTRLQRCVPTPDDRVQRQPAHVFATSGSGSRFRAAARRLRS